MLKIYNCLILLLLNIVFAQYIFGQIDTTYHTNGEIKWIRQYKDGLNIGVWKKFNNEGKIIEEIEHFADNNFEIKTYKYRGNTILYSKFLGYYDSTGKEIINGTYFSYRNGSIQELSNYKEGVLHGKQIFFIKDSIKIKETNFKNGKKNGVYREYYRNGNIKELGRFRNNYKIGKWKNYYESGVLKNKGRYCPLLWILDYENFNDFTFKVMNEQMIKLTEEEYSYQIKQNLESITTLDKRKSFIMPQKIYCKDGKWMCFDETGEIKRIEKYKKGCIKYIKDL